MSIPTDPATDKATGLPTHPLLDESINLDDDSILSPHSNESTQSSPLAQLDALEPSLTGPTATDPEVADPDGETARIMAEAKSMENILLETSPTLELGSDSLLTASSIVSASSVTSDETSASSQMGPLPDSSDVTTSPGDFTKPKDDKTEKEEEEEEGSSPITTQDNRVPQLSSYFRAESTTTNSSSFFDNLATATSAQSPAGEEETESDVLASVPGDHVSTSDIPPPGELHIRERTISMASEEATPVSFEEDKGTGLKYVGSMDSVNKFFSETTETEVDVEGKGFFDSFTAGATDTIEEQTTNAPPGQVEGLSGPVPVTQPISIPGSASNNIPPETPPIPHEPMSMSPLPSPIHTTFMRQRSISQSQGSPAPSPIHSTSTTEAPGTDENPPLETPESAPGLQNTFPSGDDLFTSSLSMSDTDRRHDAWIPSELTRQSIVSMVTNAPGSYTLEPEQLTTPGITINDPFGDPVKELVQRFMGEVEANKRITLTTEDVSQDIEGVRNLISGECWRSAADLTGKLLEDLGQGSGKAGEVTSHTSKSLGIWFCRIALLVKMRLYSHAEAECQAFGNLDRPDLYYEYYPDLHPGRRGSMVPFSFRILHAELPQFLGKTQESLDRLYYVQAITKKIIENLESGLAEDGSMLQLGDEGRLASLDLWMLREVRLLYAIGNCLLSNKDFGMAVEVFEQLLKKDNTVQTDDLYCGIGRIYLQMGDIKAAQRHFAKAESNSDPTNPEIKCRNLMNKGFIALGQDLFAEAHNYFKQATAIDPINAVAVNNMAVCSLYMGQLKEALNTLEVLVHQDPTRFLQEGILFNLCTLYELESSRPLHKKQALLHLVSKHKGNGFNIACLKMT